MQTYIADVIPKIQRFSEKLDNTTLLTNQHWVLIDRISEEKKIYLFRPNNELLISKNGMVEKGRWEYLGNKSLVIDQGNQAYLFRFGFMDKNILALRIDTKEEYALFVNENVFSGEVNSFSKLNAYINENYLDDEDKSNAAVVTPPKRSPEEQLKYDEKMNKEAAVALVVVFILFIIVVVVAAYFGTRDHSTSQVINGEGSKSVRDILLGDRPLEEFLSGNFSMTPIFLCY